MPKSSSPGTNGHVDPGVSIRFGPVEDKDVKMEDAETDVLGAAKRKSRTSITQQKSYAESSEEDEPLVRLPPIAGRAFSPACDTTVALGYTSNHSAEQTPAHLRET